MKKCIRLEGLFVFSDEKLNKHLEICEDCKFEMEKLNKVSNLIQEAKPLYFKRKMRFKTACAIGLIILSGAFLSFLNTDFNFNNSKYNEMLSAEDYGFPVDSYGFIVVGE